MHLLELSQLPQMYSLALEIFRSKKNTLLLTLILLQSFQPTHTATSTSWKLYDPKIIKVDKTKIDGQGFGTGDARWKGIRFTREVWAIPK